MSFFGNSELRSLGDQVAARLSVPGCVMEVV